MLSLSIKVPSPVMYNICFSDTVPLLINNRDVVYSLLMFPGGLIQVSILLLSCFWMPCSLFHVFMGMRSIAVQIFGKFAPFPGSVLFAIVFMPMVLAILLLMRNLFPSHPLESARQIIIFVFLHTLYGFAYFIPTPLHLFLSVTDAWRVCV